LILHGLQAISNSAQEENEVNDKSVEIAIVGVDTPFKILTSEEIKEYLSKLPNFKHDDQLVVES